MQEELRSDPLEPFELATMLEAIAALLVSFHRSDIALQEALSILAAHARATPDMVDLQHVDLVTQTHSDLAKLLNELANCMSGRPTSREDLKSVLTLRSLQDSLIEPSTTTEAGPASGELALF